MICLVINGGIDSVAAAKEQLEIVDGVMIGRKAYADPLFLAELEREVLGQKLCSPDLAGIVSDMAAYAARELSRGARLHHISRHMLGLVTGRPGARRWRRFVTEQSARPGAGPEVLRNSLDIFDEAA